MKISKLFHWLYAILMLLPVFYVLGTCLYFIFNENAVPTTLDNIFIDSVNNINSLPLFSWASNSFLVAPFQYVSNLFGVPTDSPIITLLSYWLDISLIWLVFDVIIYVPLLVHRWLDKGVIE